MAHIYIITNKTNNKSYIGKTEHIDPNKRWQEHCQDYKRDYYKKRPLYKAMNKYGLENFTFKILIKTKNPEIDEVLYIEKYNTYNKGYNATLGGDGKKLINESREQEIIRYYLKNPDINYSDLKRKFNHDNKTFKNIFLKHNINYTYVDTKQGASKKVNKYDLKGNLITSFKSSSEAARDLGDITKNKNITNCCNGKRKTAYKFIWKWAVQ